MYCIICKNTPARPHAKTCSTTCGNELRKRGNYERNHRKVVKDREKNRQYPNCLWCGKPMTAEYRSNKKYHAGECAALAAKKVQHEREFHKNRKCAQPGCPNEKGYKARYCAEHSSLRPEYEHERRRKLAAANPKPAPQPKPKAEPKPYQGKGIAMLRTKNAAELNRRLDIIAKIDMLRQMGREDEARALHCENFKTQYR